MESASRRRLKQLRFSDLLIQVEAGSAVGQIEFREGRIVSPLPEILQAEARELASSVIERWTTSREEEFRIEHDGVPYRASIATTVEGSYIFLRRAFRFTGKLDDLGLMPQLVRVLREMGRHGSVGLVLLAGRSGVGKTTLATTVFVEWLNSYGGVGVTVDDPVEHILSTCLQQGKVLQFEAKKLALPNGTVQTDFASAIIRTKRLAPNYTLIGEIRRAPEAQEAVSAGMAGTLALATIHGADIPSSIMTLARIASEGNSNATNASVGEGLRAVIHMDLRVVHGRRVLDVVPLLVEGESEHAIRATIRDGRFEMLGTYIESTRIALERSRS